MKVPFLDLVGQYHMIKSEIDLAMEQVISSASFIGGHYVKAFEAEFAKYCNTGHCVGVGNGTDALEIILEALNFEKNAEIIVPANSFIASSEAVTRAGYKVVFADCNKDDYTICVEDVRKKITNKTKAIIAVHLYGHPCDLDGLNQLAKSNGLVVIEDAAQAHGALYKGHRVGGLGVAAAFSFYPGKNLGAYGDAGAITTNDPSLAEQCRKIANHGRIGKYDHLFEGRNSRLDGLQASVLSCKLKYLDEWTDRRRHVAKLYKSGLANVSGLILPQESATVTQVYHLFVIRVERPREVQAYLQSMNIDSGIHYPIALPMLPAYEYCGQSSEPLFANQSAGNLLSLPIGEHLNDEQIEYVIDNLKVLLS